MRLRILGGEPHAPAAAPARGPRAARSPRPRGSRRARWRERYADCSIAWMPANRIRRVRAVPSPATSTSIVSPSPTEATLPVQTSHPGPGRPTTQAPRRGLRGGGERGDRASRRGGRGQQGVAAHDELNPRPLAPELRRPGAVRSGGGVARDPPLVHGAAGRRRRPRAACSRCSPARWSGAAGAAGGARAGSCRRTTLSGGIGGIVTAANPALAEQELERAGGEELQVVGREAVPLSPAAP